MNLTYMTSEQIHDLLEIGGFDYSDVARLLNVSRAVVSNVCSGRRKSKRIENTIGLLIGVYTLRIMSHDQQQEFKTIDPEIVGFKPIYRETRQQQ